MAQLLGEVSNTLATELLTPGCMFCGRALNMAPMINAQTAKQATNRPCRR
jgi:hypothetical protein